MPFRHRDYAAPLVLILILALAACAQTPDDGLTFEQRAKRQGFTETFAQSPVRTLLYAFGKFGEGYSRGYAPATPSAPLSCLTSTHGGFTTLWCNGELVGTVTTLD